MRATRRVGAVLATVALLVGLTACAQDALAEQYREGSNKGFIAADRFQTDEIAPEKRGDAVQFTGTLDNGDVISSSDYAGQVLVVNFWYASCGPCIIEAPVLEQAHQSVAGEDVAFLGFNIYDQAPTSLAFARDNAVTYPSLMSISDSDLKLAFYQHVPMTAVPSTLVIDREGRVAARLIGSLSEPSILETLVREALAERS